MQQYPISKIYINGFKSIRELDLELSNVNILIGANGSGKSNFIQFFKLLNKMINAELANYTISKGGANYFFHWGMKNTQKIKAKLEFNRNIYEFSLNINLVLTFFGKLNFISVRCFLSWPIIETTVIFFANSDTFLAIPRTPPRY